MALFAALLWVQAAALAEPAGMAWLAEGKVFLVRGTSTYVVADGITVLEGDIFSTQVKSQVQLNFADGSSLNAGPGTRFMVVAAPAKGAADVALLEGWIKVGQRTDARGLRISTPLAQASLDGAAAVILVRGGSLQAFVESGTLTFSATGDKQAAAARKVRAGEFLSYRNRQAAIQPRPAREFLEAMPRHFRDPLPEPPDKVKGRKAEPKREGDVAYEEVADWLNTSLPVRKGFVKRFMPRAHDPHFRAALVAHLREHPEWDRVLFPEKYDEEPNRPSKSGIPATGAKP
jgi:hypothetical protein